MWSLEYDRNKHVYETETDSQVQSTGLWLPRGVGAEEGWRNRLTGTENRLWLPRRVGAEEGRLGSVGLAEANYSMMDKQQSPTVWHRELYSVSCDKP